MFKHVDKNMSDGLSKKEFEKLLKYFDASL